MTQLTQINVWHEEVDLPFRFNGAHIRYGNKMVRTPHEGPWYDPRHAKIMKLLNELESELYELYEEELA